jgi:16S rRNA (uracil1498-N3)-methyltransferase
LNLFYQPKLVEGFLQLDLDESIHATRVLRYTPGQNILVTDGLGTIYDCLITSTAGKCCVFDVLSKKYIEPPKYSIHIGIAPTKSSDRTEWFVEKCTELGIQKISFIQTQHSERSKINLDRAKKVAIAAMKQSGQAWLPQMEGMVAFKEILNGKEDQKFIATVSLKESEPLFSVAKKNKSYLVIIGPEGDFSTEEIQQAEQSGFHTISLGANRLRTETAGIVACHILNLKQL